jgi:carboxypeptidase Taq
MPMNAQAAYAELVRRTREAAVVLSCAELLSWDELTYMPPGGIENRGSQMAFLAGLHHERSTDPRIGELLNELESSPLIADAESPAAVNVRELRRTYSRQTRLPRPLVEELARVTSVAQQEWETAKEDDRFSLVQPWLERIVSLKRDEAECLGHQGVAYDALLDEYEPGMTSRELSVLFESLRTDLMPLLQRILASGRRPHVAILRRDFPIDRQHVFAETLASTLGFDFHRGRLDTTSHPFFSAIGPGDCRITTRYRHNQFSEAFFATLHEVGHALYEQGLDPEHYGTPMGESSSLGIHESQSRLWENNLGRSRAFWEHFLPQAQQVFHEALHGVTLDEFYHAVNHVEPSLNRVRADQVTYDLHVIVRFEMEQALISGDLPVGEIPAVWNEKYQHYLGVTPPSDSEGCLQDSHWAAGMFGYFSGYTLGNVFAAQLFAAATRELGDLSSQFAEGDFSAMLNWLRRHIHHHGQRYSAPDLIRRATGSTPDHRPFIVALEQRYGELYGI